MTRRAALDFAIACIEQMHGSVTEDGTHEAATTECGCEHTEAVEELCALIDEDSYAPPYLIEGMSKAKLLKLAKRWETAHCDAGIIGSEYYADPERVFAFVKSNREATMNALRRAKRARSDSQEGFPS